MRRLWLLFAQTVTICLGVLFIVATLRPDWIHGPSRAPEPAQPAPVATSAPQILSYHDAVEQATPSVVNIYTSKHVNVPLIPLPADPELERLFRDTPGFSRRKATTSLGSGVIVRPDGYILTNYHVVEAADAIQVALSDGRAARAGLVGADPESDLAVLKIDLPDLKAIAFNGDHQVRIGDVVLAIGNPFGVGQTTTMGIVSALGRNRLGINIYENFIQTDAAVNPGNSGGALIDTSGRLIGINTAIYSETGGSLGIGFAIPAGAAQIILNQIVEHGAVTRGWLGVEPQDITPDLARAFKLKQDDGVIVAGVLRDGPAFKAGIRVGDIIVKMNDQAVLDSIDFLNQIAPLAPGQRVTLTLVRDGRLRNAEVDIGKRPPIRRP
ncbi:trypsin-like peptidase domain-containing protein [Pusillimonas sp. MFBS29]|uniref:trypsin-like peptidase domain-containing protein n=1 Tax=Pusillimonas sp. MFBS29 TaxID=2886690 RepID=UPI001D10BF4C|nr:trypsin-like peptidase domain-containing protein [Pusillimonas sp. MFBS29]MCC2596200.1 trypsin-like peptidase domain-containing protein [Pusillimonas sp. MFBS29]